MALNIPNQMAPGIQPLLAGMKAYQEMIEQQRLQQTAKVAQQSAMQDLYFKMQQEKRAQGKYPGELQQQSDVHRESALKSKWEELKHDPVKFNAYINQVANGGPAPQREGTPEPNQDHMVNPDGSTQPERQGVSGQTFWGEPVPAELMTVPGVNQFIAGNQEKSSDPQILEMQNRFYNHIKKLNSMGQQGQGLAVQPTTVSQEPQIAQPIDWSKAQKNPVISGILKTELGIDPAIASSETPAEKRANDAAQARADAKFKVGLAQEEALQSGLGKQKAESYGDTVKAIGVIGEKAETLKQIANSLEHIQDPGSVIGPVNSWLTKYVGTPEQQKFLGELQVGSGDIMMAAAHDIKGAFNGRDQSFVSSMKPNPNDPYYVFLGKLKAQGEFTDLMKQRLESYATNIHKGMPEHEAMAKAQKSTQFDKVENNYKKVIEIAEKRSELQQNKIPEFKNKQEFSYFMSHITPQEKIRLIAMTRK